MKMVVAIVDDQMAAGLIETLTRKGFRLTKLSSTGGFLRRGSTTILSGVDDSEAKLLVQVIKDYLEARALKSLEVYTDQTRSVQRGTATVFVLPVEQMMQI